MTATDETAPPYDDKQQCRACGCMNDCGCIWLAEVQPADGIKWDGPCGWVEYDLCTQCNPSTRKDYHGDV